MEGGEKRNETEQSHERNGANTVSNGLLIMHDSAMHWTEGKARAIGPRHGLV